MGKIINGRENISLPINPSNRINRLGAGGLPSNGIVLDDNMTK